MIAFLLSSKERKAIILLDKLLDKLDLKQLRQALWLLYARDYKFNSFVALMMKIIAWKEHGISIVSGVDITALLEGKYEAVIGVSKEICKGFDIGGGIKVSVSNWKDLRFWIGFLWQL